MFPNVTAVIHPHATAAFVKVQEKITIRQICQATNERVRLLVYVQISSVFIETVYAKTAEVMRGQAPLLQQSRNGAAAPQPNRFVQVNIASNNRADGGSFADSRYN